MANVFPTPGQINAAMSAVDAARQDDTVPADIKTQLEQMSNALQEIQDAMILQTEQDIINALADNNKDLETLTGKINDLCCNLDHVASTIKTVSTTVGVVVSVISALV